MVDVGHELELAWLHRERQHDERERETTRREEKTTNGNYHEQPDEQQPGDPALVNNVPAEDGTMDVLCRDATPETADRIKTHLNLN